ncbi:hypothetical protein V6N13_014734 [Hibiscus sabdariffa]
MICILYNCGSLELFIFFVGFKVGIGCMGLSGAYNDLVPGDVGISIIKHAFDIVITLFDTSDLFDHFQSSRILKRTYKKCEFILSTMKGSSRFSDLWTGPSTFMYAL